MLGGVATQASPGSACVVMHNRRPSEAAVEAGGEGKVVKVVRVVRVVKGVGVSMGCIYMLYEWCIKIPKFRYLTAVWGVVILQRKNEGFL